MKIGRYEIKFGKYFWLQTGAPTTIRRMRFKLPVEEERNAAA